MGYRGWTLCSIRGGITRGVTGGIAAAMDRRDMGQDITGGTIVGSVAGGLRF